MTPAARTGSGGPTSHVAGLIPDQQLRPIREAGADNSSLAPGRKGVAVRIHDLNDAEIRIYVEPPVLALRRKHAIFDGAVFLEGAGSERREHVGLHIGRRLFTAQNQGTR